MKVQTNTSGHLEAKKKLYRTPRIPSGKLKSGLYSIPLKNKFRINFISFTASIEALPAQNMPPRLTAEYRVTFMIAMSERKRFIESLFTFRRLKDRFEMFITIKFIFSIIN